MKVNYVTSYLFYMYIDGQKRHFHFSGVFLLCFLSALKGSFSLCLVFFLMPSRIISLYT